MNTSNKLLPLNHMKTALRQLKTSSVNLKKVKPEDTETFRKLVENQKKFQADDGVEDVYLKKGPVDVFIYRVLVVGTIIGFIDSMATIYNFAHK